jgi:acetylornithine deacetylase
MSTGIERQIGAYVDADSARLIELTQNLVRRPSENRAPIGSELACQEYAADILRSCGFNCELYTPDEAPGITSHPLYWPGREYRNRPNVAARKSSSGQGRSLVLSGHSDTVPAGTLPWTRNPFGGEVGGNRLYGRGSNDMKGGIATNLFVAEALRDLGITLAGDLIIESPRRRSDHRVCC